MEATDEENALLLHLQPTPQVLFVFSYPAVVVLSDAQSVVFVLVLCGLVIFLFSRTLLFAIYIFVDNRILYKSFPEKYIQVIQILGNKLLTSIQTREQRQDSNRDDTYYSGY